MKYAICNETFADWPLERALTLASDLGYTGWEVAPFTLANVPNDFDAAARADYRRQVESAGLRIIGLHWLLAKTEGYHLTTPDPVVRAATTDYFGTLVDLCGDLGGDLMVLGSPQQRNVPHSQSMESAVANAAEVLSGVVPDLERRGVRIAVEPLGRGEGNFLNTADQAMDLIERVGSEHVRLHLDVKAMSDEPDPIDQIIREHSRAMIHFHANDPNLRGPGMGDVDFVPIFAALEAVGYDGWVSVEVFDYSPGVETLARESMVNMLAARSAITDSLGDVN